MRKSEPAICLKLNLNPEGNRTRRSDQYYPSHLKLKLRTMVMEDQIQRKESSVNRHKEFIPYRKDFNNTRTNNYTRSKTKLFEQPRNLRSEKTPSIETERFTNSIFKIRQEGRTHRSVKAFDSTEGKCEIYVLDNGNKTKYIVKATTVEDLNKRLMQDCSADVVCFKTVPPNIVYDFYLSQPQCEIRFLNDKSITLRPHYRTIQKKVDLRSFEIVRCIGSGGFSKVYLARFKQDGRFYALKLIDKHFILQNRKKGIIQNERKIMALLDHPFTLGLKYAFETIDLLVFVMDYCAGGSLFTYVKHYRTMNQDMARFFLLEILLGIEHLHDMDIVYRDIKPQNILVALDGHIKIADFGLAKPQINKQHQAYSFCGSPEYMAPEMIMKIGHAQPVDFYCIGALLYELVTGLPPYYSTNTDQIYQAVLEQELTFPDDLLLTKDCKELLYSLLNKNHILRLGSLNGVREILAHPWFGKFKREDVLNKLLKPPIKIDHIKTVTFNLMMSEQYNEIDKLIEKQQRSDSQFFRKIMKNFYYDYTSATTEECIQKENITARSPACHTLKTEFNYLITDDYGSSRKLNTNEKKSPQPSRKIKRQSRNVLNQSNCPATFRKYQYL